MEEENSAGLDLLENISENLEPVQESDLEPVQESDLEPVQESEPVWEEPVWEEPVFEDVTISSVAWAGSKHWDRAIYTLSNGNTAFASKGLDAGDSPFDYEEIRTSGGGYFSDPGGIVGHTHTRNGGALIIKQGESFLQQQYAWGNQGPVMSPNTSDVTKQIGSIEEREQEDMNGDGFIGAPEEDEAEVEVSSIVYENTDANFDRSIYRMTDGSVRLAEQGLSIGDLPYEAYDQLKSKDGSPIETLGIVGAIWMNNGFAVLYNNDSVVTQQAFKWGNSGLRPSGRLRDVTKQIDTIEEREGIDVNGDGRVGNELSEDAEVQSVVYDNPDAGFDRSIYKMTDGTVRLAEQGLSAGDLPFEGDDLSEKDGSPLGIDGLVGILGLRNGFGIIYNNNGVIMQQQFKWGGRGIKASGKLRDVTKQLALIEEREGIDVNGDGLIGEQFEEDAEVLSVLFSPDPEAYDRSLYELTSGDVVLAEIGLRPGEIPFESDPLSYANGTSIEADRVVGLIGTRSGEAVIFKNGESYSMQQFKWAGRGLKPKGKEHDITRRIYEVEEREYYDFTGDLIIGDPSSSSSDDLEVRRVIFPGNDEFSEGLYQMDNGDLVFAESDLSPGDTPFEDEIITGKNGKPYQGDYVVGIYPIKNGFALIENVEGIYKEQGFRFKGGGRPQPFGKARAVKDIGKIESKYGFDLDNDGLVDGGSNVDDLGPAFRLIQQLDLNNISDPLA